MLNFHNIESELVIQLIVTDTMLFASQLIQDSICMV